MPPTGAFFLCEVGMAKIGEREAALRAQREQQASAAPTVPPLRLVTSDGVTATPTALEMDPTLSYDAWIDIGANLSRVEGALKWWLGDWWAFGDNAYGERAAQVLGDPDGPSYQTYKNAGAVSRRFERYRRRYLLSWSHHEAVASLDPEIQDQFLDTAERESLSVSRLRTLVREHKRLIEAGADPEDLPPEPVGPEKPPEDVIGAWRRLRGVADDVMSALEVEDEAALVPAIEKLRKPAGPDLAAIRTALDVNTDAEILPAIKALKKAAGIKTRHGARTWLTPYLEAWEAAMGGALGAGKTAAALKPLERQHGPDETLKRWGHYLATFEGRDKRYASPAHFSEHFGAFTNPENGKPRSGSPARQVTEELPGKGRQRVSVWEPPRPIVNP